MQAFVNDVIAEKLSSPLIRVKCIYNFLVIHANFVMLSHVSIIISLYFYAFCWTNLLTTCPVPVSCFCYFCISENLLLEIFSELDENLRELFLRQDEDGVQRAASEAPHRPGEAPCRGPRATAGGTRPCPVGTPSAPSDAYKITLTLKTSRRPLFSREVTPRRRHHKP